VAVRLELTYLVTYFVIGSRDPSRRKRAAPDARQISRGLMNIRRPIFSITKKNSNRSVLDRPRAPSKV
jgi:hypothetical protein